MYADDKERWLSLFYNFKNVVPMTATTDFANFFCTHFTASERNRETVENLHRMR